MVVFPWKKIMERNRTHWNQGWKSQDSFQFIRMEVCQQTMTNFLISSPNIDKQVFDIYMFLFLL